ncbi:MAG TPA: PAS domain-containing sensor histidine kinase [Pyrinomonadaceae bacterium]|nr:PAS domain-containing sensor histidine kinase [Pyrinomonadaceae bacterium]
MSSPKVKNTLVKMNFSPIPKRSRAAWQREAAREAATNVAQYSAWHDSEKLFFQVFDNSAQPMSITTLADGRYLEANPTFLTRLGYARDQVIGHTSLELGIWKNSAQRAELVTRLKKDGRVRGFETAIRGANDETLIWLSSADLIDVDGEPCILVISDDITERRRFEEQLRNISAHLIRAQEDERNRIARELHDGLNQKLALLCVDLEEFGRSQPDVGVSKQLNALSSRLQDASADVHGLSHRLHPSKLDHLGLLPAVKSLCRELSGRRGLQIEFVGDENLGRLEKDLALCAYRVIQEALSNAIKHSGAVAARVQVKCRKHVLYLLVTDSGRGFSMEVAKLKGRLGLISMEERLRLANGRLIVRSRPNRGTQIEARIPLGN